MDRTTTDTSTPLTALEYTDLCDTRDDALAGWDFCKCQRDYLGGRVNPPSTTHPRRWQIQAFFSADGVDLDAFLCDGLRRVVVPASIQRRLGIGS